LNLLKRTQKLAEEVCLCPMQCKHLHIACTQRNIKMVESVLRRWRAWQRLCREGKISWRRREGMLQRSHCLETKQQGQRWRVLKQCQLYSSRRRQQLRRGPPGHNWLTPAWTPQLQQGDSQTFAVAHHVSMLGICLETRPSCSLNSWVPAGMLPAIVAPPSSTAVQPIKVVAAQECSAFKE